MTGRPSGVAWQLLSSFLSLSSPLSVTFLLLPFFLNLLFLFLPLPLFYHIPERYKLYTFFTPRNMFSCLLNGRFGIKIAIIKLISFLNEWFLLLFKWKKDEYEGKEGGEHIFDRLEERNDQLIVFWFQVKGNQPVSWPGKYSTDKSLTHARSFIDSVLPLFCSP